MPLSELSREAPKHLADDANHRANLVARTYAVTELGANLGGADRPFFAVSAAQVDAKAEPARLPVVNGSPPTVGERSPM